MCSEPTFFQNKQERKRYKKKALKSYKGNRRILSKWLIYVSSLGTLSCASFLLYRLFY